MDNDEKVKRIEDGLKKLKETVDSLESDNNDNKLEEIDERLTNELNHMKKLDDEINDNVKALEEKGFIDSEDNLRKKAEALYNDEADVVEDDENDKLVSDYNKYVNYLVNKYGEDFVPQLNKDEEKNYNRLSSMISQAMNDGSDLEKELVAVNNDINYLMTNYESYTKIPEVNKILMIADKKNKDINTYPLNNSDDYKKVIEAKEELINFIAGVKDYIEPKKGNSLGFVSIMLISIVIIMFIAIAYLMLK